MLRNGLPIDRLLNLHQKLLEMTGIIFQFPYFPLRIFAVLIRFSEHIEYVDKGEKIGKDYSDCAPSMFFSVIYLLAQLLTISNQGKEIEGVIAQSD